MELDGRPILEDQGAVVTGAGQGLGREIALALAKAGARVIVADIDPETAASTAEEIKRRGGAAWPLAWNVSNPAEAAQVASKVKEIVGDISILVNNAGIHRRGLVGTPDHMQAWRDIMSVNLDGTLFGITAFLEQLKRTRGCIVN